MTREIKFRGLRTDGKGWVYGYLVITPEGEHRIYWRPFAESRSNTWHTVIPGSVGQYTGLKYKNGVEIYEGDLITQPFFKSTSDFSKGKAFTVPVVFNIESAGFDIDISKVARPYSTFTPFEDCEVSGNIHQESEVTNGI